MNESDAGDLIRLQKFLAECGVASRRASEKLIEQGFVTVDGEVVTALGTRVDPARSRVTYEGNPVVLDEKVWMMLNKPTGVICTSEDPQGRETILDMLPSSSTRLYTVGRLDVMSEGLLLVSNDGELAHRLMHPRHHVEKKYQVWIDREFTTHEIEQMLKGLHSRGERLKVLRVEPLRRMMPHQSGYTFTLGEGRNRHIRRMMEVLGRKVVRLVRVSMGPLRLEKLRTGEHRNLDVWEVEKLRKSVGL